MVHKKKRNGIYLFVVYGLLLGGCAGVEYVDPDSATLVDDKYSDADVNIMAEEMAGSLMSLPELTQRETPPRIALLRIRNLTSEHINTDAIADKIRIALLKTGRVRFVDRDNIDKVVQELQFGASGFTNPDKTRQIGKLAGTDYFLAGELESIEKQKSTKSLTWYRCSFRLTDVETGEIIWADEKELKKKYQKNIMDW